MASRRADQFCRARLYLPTVPFATDISAHCSAARSGPRQPELTHWLRSREHQPWLSGTQAPGPRERRPQPSGGGKRLAAVTRAGSSRATSRLRATPAQPGSREGGQRRQRVYVGSELRACVRRGLMRRLKVTILAEWYGE